jgi:hypothetical protein
MSSDPTATPALTLAKSKGFERETLDLSRREAPAPA